MKDLIFLKQTGCKIVRPGIESLDPEILKAMNKKITPGQIREGVERILTAGIQCWPFIIIGYPMETEKSLEITLRFLEEFQITQTVATFLIPLPGTLLHQQARRRGLIANPVQFLRDLQFYEERPVVNMTSLPDEVLIAAKERVLTLKK